MLVATSTQRALGAVPASCSTIGMTFATVALVGASLSSLELLQQADSGQQRGTGKPGHRWPKLQSAVEEDCS